MSVLRTQLSNQIKPFIMETKKLSIEQIAEAIKNENITCNEETLNGAIILINQKEKDGVHAASCLIGNVPALSASIAAQMCVDPKFREMILLAVKAHEKFEEREKALKQLEKSLDSAMGNINNLIGSLENLLGKKPARNKKRTNKR